VFELHIPADYHAEKHKQSFRVLEQTAVLKDNELANKDSNEYFFDRCIVCSMLFFTSFLVIAIYCEAFSASFYCRIVVVHFHRYFVSHVSCD